MTPALLVSSTGNQPKMKMKMKMIEKFAAAVDAAIILDRDGDVAVHARHYAGGVKQVRHKPDNGDFRPAAEWELKIAAGTAQEWVA